MNHVEATRRPAPVSLISMYCMFSALYLWILAAILILAPGTVTLTLGSRLMHGLELAGPYMMLLVGLGYALIGWGLFRLHNWARWLAMLLLALGVGSLVPVISAARFDVKFFEYGGEIAIFSAAAFYLAQAPTVLEAFVKNRRPKTMPRIDVRPHRRID
jgi:hypothetical protein